jgi:hypothetical protein
MELESLVKQEARGLAVELARNTRPFGFSEKAKKRVGFAKGSWINAAKAIGGRVRGAAQWTTRHKQSPGTATVKTGEKPAETLINKLDYIEQVTTYTGIEIALRVAAGRLRKALATSLRKINGHTNARMKRAG